MEAFRALNGVDLIIRSHEPVTAGFEWFDSGHLVTVFSATNYTGCVIAAKQMFTACVDLCVCALVRTFLRTWVQVHAGGGVPVREGAVFPVRPPFALVAFRARSNFGAFLLIDNTLKVCAGGEKGWVGGPRSWRLAVCRMRGVGDARMAPPLVCLSLQVEPRMIPPEFSRTGRLTPAAHGVPPQVAPPTPERGVRRLLHQFRSKSDKSGLDHH